MDSDLAAYLARVVDRLRDMEAVWLIGSAATGAYIPGRSDVDVVAVSPTPLSEPQRRALAADLSHERLPCPARKLELVVYARTGLELQLNLNTGRAAHSVAPPEPFWLVLDLAAAREAGRPLVGPPPDTIVPPIPRDELLAAMGELLDWYEREEPESPGRVLAVCRVLRFRAEGVWSSKPAAARWAKCGLLS